MKKLTILITVCMSVLICMFYGCSSPEDKAKGTITKILKENTKVSVSNIEIDTYMGLCPTIFDKKIIEAGYECLKNVKTINYYNELLSSRDYSYSYADILMKRGYNSSLWSAQFSKERNEKNIKEAYESIENSKSDKEVIIALLEYDADDAVTKKHKREIIIVDPEDPTKVLKGITLSPYNNEGMLTSIQVLKSDTVITNPNKEEIKHIISLMDDRAIQYAFRDSI